MTKFAFQFTNKAEREFSLLPKDIQKRVFNKLEFFESVRDPFLYAKKLHGIKHTFRFRIGNYRVIFKPVDEKNIVILLILKVAHRKDVYD